MDRCLNCNLRCHGDFCCDGCEQKYGSVEDIDWDALEREVAAVAAARRVS